MKNLTAKILGLFLAVSCVCSSADAQTYRRGDYRRARSGTAFSRMHGGGDYFPMGYAGVRLGANAANLSFDGMHGISKSSIAGLNLGVVGGYSLSMYTPIYLESGLLYTQKGVEGSKADEDLKVNMHYLEVPLVFKYRINVNPYSVDNLNVQPFFGAFAAVGFAGKTKDFGVREKVDTFGPNAFRHFDSGLRLGCGIEFQNLYAEVSYDWGLTNVARSNFKHLGFDSFDDKIHTSTLSATVGFNF